MSSDHAHAVTARTADICQTVVGQTLTWSEPPSGDRFEHLFSSVESPTLEAARRVIDSALHAFTRTLAETVHASFHRRFATRSGCDFRAPEFTLLRDEKQDGILVHESLEQWAGAWRNDFRRAHDSAAQRARRALEASSATASIDDVARTLGVGKRTLERHFRREIGVSVAEYRTRLRLAAMVTELRPGAGCVESAALTAGWMSRRNGYKALRERTGLTPTAVRELTHAESEGLTTSLMICGRAGRHCAPCARFSSAACPRHHSPDNYPVRFRSAPSAVECSASPA